MKKSRKILLGFVILICTVAATVTAAGSMWEGNKKAQLLSLLFGSFAAGATMANLIRDIRKRK